MKGFNQSYLSLKIDLNNLEKVKMKIMVVIFFNVLQILNSDLMIIWIPKFNYNQVHHLLLPSHLQLLDRLWSMNIELDIVFGHIDMTNKTCFLKIIKNQNSEIVRQSKQNEV